MNCQLFEKYSTGVKITCHHQTFIKHSYTQMTEQPYRTTFKELHKVSHSSNSCCIPNNMQTAVK